MWCLAHRLKLAVKDALSTTFFSSPNNMLIRLYYLYEKSPKKCAQLKAIAEYLRDAFQFDDNGVRPVRSCGTRGVCHKLKAIKRVLSKYGAYVAHLTTLSEDPTVKVADRAKLKVTCVSGPKPRLC